MTIQRPTADIPTILEPVVRALGFHFKTAHDKGEVCRALSIRRF